uniref:Uncharacterized protein n=1 Tax=Rhipicephalus microplus TaxID=6941 RepID=A0A6G5AHN5_RHIMP
MYFFCLHTHASCFSVACIYILPFLINSLVARKRLSSLHVCFSCALTDSYTMHIQLAQLSILLRHLVMLCATSHRQFCNCLMFRREKLIMKTQLVCNCVASTHSHQK